MITHGGNRETIRSLLFCIFARISKKDRINHFQFSHQIISIILFDSSVYYLKYYLLQQSVHYDIFLANYFTF